LSINLYIYRAPSTRRHRLAFIYHARPTISRIRQRLRTRRLSLLSLIRERHSLGCHKSRQHKTANSPPTSLVALDTKQPPMASNEYYNSHGASMPGEPPLNPPHGVQDPSARPASPFHQSDYAPSYRTTDPHRSPYEQHVEPSLPSIASRSNSTAYHPSGGQQLQPYQNDIPPAGISPFTTPFDDPSHPDAMQNTPPPPADSYGSPIRRDSLYSPSTMTASQYGSVRHAARGPDTGYYGAEPPLPPPLENQSSDAIPLQDRPHKEYDATAPMYASGANPAAGQGVLPTYAVQQPDAGTRKGHLGYGELGMFRSSGKKRIPWVVYALTVAQIAVFIGEIIKNGMSVGLAGLGLVL
jgi:hypothetical protein